MRAKATTTRKPHATAPALLRALVCPVTQLPLVYSPAAQELISPAAGLA
ncbi:MAG: Trm112 family protein, partial [Alphaproteobacteria bacterium]